MPRSDTAVTAALPCPMFSRKVFVRQQILGRIGQQRRCGFEAWAEPIDDLLLAAERSTVTLGL